VKMDKDAKEARESEDIQYNFIGKFEKRRT
jgi:hypothetical protein